MTRVPTRCTSACTLRETGTISGEKLRVISHMATSDLTVDGLEIPRRLGASTLKATIPPADRAGNTPTADVASGDLSFLAGCVGY